MMISLAMKLGEEGYEELKNAADPRRAICMEALHKGLDVWQTNDLLEDAGLPSLGSDKYLSK